MWTTGKLSPGAQELVHQQREDPVSAYTLSGQDHLFMECFVLVLKNVFSLSLHEQRKESHGSPTKHYSDYCCNTELFNTYFNQNKYSNTILYFVWLHEGKN